MRHVPPPAPVDLLDQAIDHVRPHLDCSVPLVKRARVFWAAVAAARNLGAADVVEADFAQLAADTGLSRDLRREDLQHLLRWGQLNRNPFF